MKWKLPQEWEKLKQGIDCPICEDMHLEENRFSFKVIELQQGIVRLARNQYLPGYTVVIFRRHANELFELSVQELTEFWQDVSRVAKVLYDLYQPTKVNYLVFGHHCPHLHCHLVIHSYEDDPSKPVDWNEETVLLSPQQYQHIIAEMQKNYKRRSEKRPLCSLPSSRYLVAQLVGFESLKLVQITLSCGFVPDFICLF